MLERNTITIVVEGKLIEVKFPEKISQQLNIEANKSLLSYGKYGLLAFNNMNSSLRILDIVDMFAHFSEVIPELPELLGMKKGDKLMELPMKVVKPLVEQYNTIYAPFYNKYVTKDEMIGTPEVIDESIRKQAELEAEALQKNQQA